MSAAAFALAAPLAAAGAVVLTVAVAVAAPVWAQPPSRTVPLAPERADSAIVEGLRRIIAQPLMIDRLRPGYAPARGPLAARAFTPLDNARLERLRRAVAMRERGERVAARDSLRKLLDDTPHHPVVLAEFTRTLLVLQDYAGVEHIARAERQSQSDSLMLGRELVEAEERLGRPTEAALVAVEMWAKSPLEAVWAGEQVKRLLTADAGRVREALRRALQRETDRDDLARGLARLDWRAGDATSMRRTLLLADRSNADGSVRWGFAEELLQGGGARDSTAALDVLIDVASDRALQGVPRRAAAARAWELCGSRAAPADGAARIAKALADLPQDQWDGAMALALARVLREAGRTAEARDLLASRPGSVAPADLALERALTDLRDGPADRALSALRIAAAGSAEGAYQYAQALFFAGACDSAHAWFVRVAADPGGGHTGAALERAYLIEDAEPKSALPLYSAAAYAEWRGDAPAASVIAESLYRALPRGTLWAEVALMLSGERLAAGVPRAALEPLLALADSLPEDRLAPLARQRAGDLCRDRLKDAAGAIVQYEACLTRYPRAWNAPEVRRSLEKLRGERRL